MDKSKSLKLAILILSVLVFASGLILVFKALNPAKSEAPGINSNNSTNSSTSTQDQEKPAESQNFSNNSSSSTLKGSYITYAEYQSTKDQLVDSKVIYFFRAKWCITCEGLHQDIKANLDSIPSNVVIVDVDYDQENELRKQYSIVMQHTLVQISQSGSEVTKFSGSPTLSDLITSIK
jgi:thiol-disulfide isomerase/thioredoxin